MTDRKMVEELEPEELDTAVAEEVMGEGTTSTKPRVGSDGPTTG